MVENAMVLSRAADPTDPRNAADMPDYECSCGQDHTSEVKVTGYPKWHSQGKFVDECAAECGGRCCHDCAAVCRICQKRFCPDCRKGFHKGLELCEDCKAYYETFAPTMDKGDLEKLIQIEKRRKLPAYSFGREPLDSEIDWLIETLKETLEGNAELLKKETAPKQLGYASISYGFDGQPKVEHHDTPEAAEKELRDSFEGYEQSGERAPNVDDWCVVRVVRSASVEQKPFADARIVVKAA